MARDTPVFISYARSDERYATELMRRLAQEPDIAPWQDRISMSPGDFEDQIKAGIDSSDYLVLVMTPAALKSPWVEKEWRYARENGRCIVPIKPTFDSPDADAELSALRAQLPVWMQKIQTYDFDRYWKRFVAVLQSPCQATRSPFLAANLPANFVNRPAEFNRIVEIGSRRHAQEPQRQNRGAARHRRIRQDHARAERVPRPRRVCRLRRRRPVGHARRAAADRRRARADLRRADRRAARLQEPGRRDVRGREEAGSEALPAGHRRRVELSGAAAVSARRRVGVAHRHDAESSAWPSAPRATSAAASTSAS